MFEPCDGVQGAPDGIRTKRAKAYPLSTGLTPAYSALSYRTLCFILFEVSRRVLETLEWLARHAMNMALLWPFAHGHAWPSACSTSYQHLVPICYVVSVTWLRHWGGGNGCVDAAGTGGSSFRLHSWSPAIHITRTIAHKQLHVLPAARFAQTANCSARPEERLLQALHGGSECSRWAARPSLTTRRTGHVSKREQDASQRSISCVQKPDDTPGASLL